MLVVGDLNFDYDVTSGDAGPGYYVFVDAGLVWLRPVELVRTQCGGTWYDSVLDFGFGYGVTGSAEILTDGGAAFCPMDEDDQASTDHRPVRFVLP